MKQSIKAVIFDWGDTIMRDYKLAGPMHEWNEVAWIPGAQQVLEFLQKKHPCIIATSANHSNTNDMKLALSRVGADQYFSFFYSQVELGVKKPAPLFFQKTATLSGFMPSECLMIGNLYEKDIVGAKAAGMTTAFFNETQLNGTFPKADFVIHNMEELIYLFNATTI